MRAGKDISWSQTWFITKPENKIILFSYPMSVEQRVYLYFSLSNYVQGQLKNKLKIITNIVKKSLKEGLFIKKNFVLNI